MSSSAVLVELHEVGVMNNQFRPIDVDDHVHLVLIIDSAVLANIDLKEVWTTSKSGFFGLIFELMYVIHIHT